MKNLKNKNLKVKLNNNNSYKKIIIKGSPIIHTGQYCISISLARKASLSCESKRNY